MAYGALDGVPAGAVERILYVQRDDRTIADYRPLLLERYLGRFDFTNNSVQHRSTLPVAELVSRKARVIGFLGMDHRLDRMIHSNSFPSVFRRQKGLYVDESPGQWLSRFGQ